MLDRLLDFVQKLKLARLRKRRLDERESLTGLLIWSSGKIR